EILADVRHKVAFPVVVAPTWERLVKHSLDRPVGDGSNVVRQWWAKFSERAQDCFAFLKGPVVADGNGNHRNTVGRGEERANRIHFIGNSPREVAIESQRFL